MNVGTEDLFDFREALLLAIYMLKQPKLGWHADDQECWLQRRERLLPTIESAANTLLILTSFVQEDGSVKP